MASDLMKKGSRTEVVADVLGERVMASDLMKKGSRKGLFDGPVKGAGVMASDLMKKGSRSRALVGPPTLVGYGLRPDEKGIKTFRPCGVEARRRFTATDLMKKGSKLAQVDVLELRVLLPLATC